MPNAPALQQIAKHLYLNQCRAIPTACGERKATTGRDMARFGATVMSWECGTWAMGVPQPWGSHCREAHGGMGRKGCNDHGKGDFRAVGKEGMWEGAGRAQVGALGLEVSVCVPVV